MEETSRGVKRPRQPAPTKSVPLPALGTIRRLNPDVDDPPEGPRACLLPIVGADDSLLLPGGWDPVSGPALRAMDAAADALCGLDPSSETPAFDRSSMVKAAATELQLYTLSSSAGLLAAALHSGFFPFASELLSLPVRSGKGKKRQAPKVDRAVMNFELGGPNVEPSEGWTPGGEGAPGGRIVLDLRAGSAQRLIVGKRALKTVAPALTPGTRSGTDNSGADSGQQFRYRLSVNESFSDSWAHLVAFHGVDWLGFTVVRGAFAELHRLNPTPWGASSHAAGFPRMVSVELWGESAATGAGAGGAVLASVEVGVLVGSAYTCLSLASDTARFPRCDHVRAQASVLRLQRAGVTLVDVGTTAGYFASLFGFKRTSRAEFVGLWRAARARPLRDPDVLRESCWDLKRLLQEARDNAGDGAGEGGGEGGDEWGDGAARPGVSGVLASSVTPQGASSLTTTSTSAASSAGNIAGNGGAKAAVLVTGLPAGATADDLASALARAGCGPLTRATATPLGVFVVFADSVGAAAALALDGSPVTVTLSAAGSSQPTCVILSVHAAPSKAKDQKKR